MQRFSRRGFLNAAGLSITASAMGLGKAFAQETNWPTRPITIVVGVPPGSINDAVARALGQAIAPLLGQAVVIENRGGAGGTIGTRAVARAEPDGYTLMLGTSSQLVMNVPVYAKLDFSIEKDLVAVALLSRTRFMLAVHKSVPANNLQELIALAKAQPGALNYGTNGIGSITHVATERLSREANIKMEAVHYRGSGPALQALVAGQIQMFLDSPLTAGPFVTSGELKGIAIGDRRSSTVPNVQTFEEQGLPNVDAYTWNSIMAPKGTPRPIIDKLNGTINKALESGPLATLIAQADSANLKGSTPETTDAFWQNELKLWVPTIRALNVTLE